MLFLVILLIIVACIAAVVFWNFKHLLDWETGSLEGHTNAFDLGEARPITYRAVAKNNKVLNDLDIDAQLRVEEEVYYNQGTDRRRAASDLYVAPIALTRQPEDNAVVLTGLVHLPADLPPTLDLRNNNVNWTIEIRLDPASGTQQKSKFDILVLPRVRAQGSEPDYITRHPVDDGSGPLPPTPGNFYG